LFFHFERKIDTKLLESRVVRRIFGPKKEEVTGG
jgi:hypothetical protein